MRGMFIMEFLKGFSETDASKFEDTILRWIRKSVHNPILYFERNQIKVGKTIKADDNDFIYQLKLPRLCLEYICVNADMCILLKVTRTDGETNKVIYRIPKSWGGQSPWHAEE